LKTTHNLSKCYRPTFLEENELSLRGFKLIAGIDEAGIGALAGPVVAAAVTAIVCLFMFYCCIL